jgi:hypothetical protein
LDFLRVSASPREPRYSPSSNIFVSSPLPRVLVC